jgi:hypothetical protein
MWLEREDVKLLGLCGWCENGIYEDEPHHWHIFKLKDSSTPRGLYCEYCAIKAGWLPMPEKEVA